MKKQALVLIILLLLHRSFCQDYRILQKDKGKLFIRTTMSVDSGLQVAIIHADWRLDYVQKNFPCHKEKAEDADMPDSTSFRYRHRNWHIAGTADDHHARVQVIHSFYTDMSGIGSVNGLFKLINSEYRTVMQIGDDSYKLIRHFLPDSAAEYYADGYKGSNTATVEVIYLWGAPLRDWSVGVAVSVHDREARKVLSSILCMGPNDTELGVRKIRIRQANLLEVMSYADMFCP